MPIAPTPQAPTIDQQTGRLLPLSDEQREARTEAMARAFEEWPEADETDTDERWADVFRGIDESRPHRPLFAGKY